MAPLTLDRLEAEFAQDNVECVAAPVLAASIVTEAEFENLSLPERSALLSDWFRTGDTGYIYGKRGLGKSWLALLMARALAEGGKCGPWSAPQICRVATAVFAIRVAHLKHTDFLNG